MEEDDVDDDGGGGDEGQPQKQGSWRKRHAAKGGPCSLKVRSGYRGLGTYAPN